MPLPAEAYHEEDFKSAVYRNVGLREVGAHLSCMTINILVLPCYNRMYVSFDTNASRAKSATSSIEVYEHNYSPALVPEFAAATDVVSIRELQSLRMEKAKEKRKSCHFSYND